MVIYLTVDYLMITMQLSQDDYETSVDLWSDTIAMV